MKTKTRVLIIAAVVAVLALAVLSFQSSTSAEPSIIQPANAETGVVTTLPPVVATTITTTQPNDTVVTTTTQPVATSLPPTTQPPAVAPGS